MPRLPEGPNAGREGHKDFGGRGRGVWDEYIKTLEELKEQEEEKKKGEKKEEEKGEEKGEKKPNKPE